MTDDSGEEGIRLLQQYESDSRPEDLTGAIDLLGAAVAADPDCGRPLLRYGLGVALVYRGEVADDESEADLDFDEAVRLFCQALGSTDEDGFALDVLGDLCELLWSRFRTLVPSAGEIVACDWLSCRLREIPRRGVPAEQAMVDLLAGWAYVRRCRVSEQLSDVLVAIDMIQRGLTHAPAYLPVVARGWRELAAACALAYALDPAAAWLDRGVAAAALGRRLVNPADVEYLEFAIQEGMSREQRWGAAIEPDREDLDRAIGCYEIALACVDDDGDLYGAHGELLRERGMLDGCMPDLDAAIHSLTRALECSEGPPHLLALCQANLAEAHRLRWQLAPNTPDLRAQLTSWPAVALSASGDPGLEAVALRSWVDAATELVEAAKVDRDDALAAAERASAASRSAIGRIAAQDPEEAALLSVSLLSSQLRLAGSTLNPLDREWVDELIPFLDGLSSADADLGEGIRAAVRGLLTFQDDVLDQSSWGFGVSHLRRAALAFERLGPGASQNFDALLGLVSALQGLRTGDRAALDRGRSLLGQINDGTDPDTDVMTAIVELFSAQNQDEDLVRDRNLVARAVACLDRIPVGDRAIDLMREFIAAIAQMLRAPGPAGVSRPSPPTIPVADHASLAGAFSRGTSTTWRFAAIANAFERDDLPEVRRLVEQVASSPESTDPNHPIAPQALAALGIAALELARQGDLDAVGPAVRWNDRARQALPGPQHVQWSPVHMNLALALRLDGLDPQRSRQAGFEALRGRAWQALLQSGTDEAVEAAHGAAEWAAVLAGWCAEDGAHVDLVRALEAGRSLVLHAATNDRRVADRLRALGAEDLAREWDGSGGAGEVAAAQRSAETAAAQFADDLRHRVLRFLHDVGAGRELEPPSLRQIEQAVAAQSLSALVYLVPATPTSPGMAVVVEPARPVEVVTLADLATGAGTPLPDYERAYAAAASAATTDDPSYLTWAASLHRLCDWAWQVAGRRLREVCDTRWPGRTPRLALVPVGPLALVPWHAARRAEGAGYRYLAEEAALSVVPSAQLLCELGSRDPDHPDGVVIVSNPTGDLRFAGTEAAAIRDSFYPSAVLLGLSRAADGEWRRAPGGAGSADEVLDLIERGGACATLHLACHAIADQAQPSRSRLVLGGGEELPIRSLLHRRRTELLPLDRVFLSACTTHVSGRDYDEAFSLSTAFLAAGARTVFGSLWQVVDGATSTLMYMVHRFLRAGSAPIEALCLAQRWMLDPNRQVPAEMPNELVSSLVTADPVDPMVWAGFVHLGI